MSIFKKTMKLRRDVRKSKSPVTAWYESYYQRPGSIISTIILTLFFAGVVALDNWPESSTVEYHVGQYVPNDITARQKFSVLQVGIQEETKKIAESKAPATFRLNRVFLDSVTAEVEKIPAKLSTAKSISDLPPELRLELGLEIPEQQPAYSEVGESVTDTSETRVAASQPVAESQPTSAPVASVATSQPASQPTSQPTSNPAELPATASAPAPLTPSQKLFNAWCGITLTPEKKASFEKAVSYMRDILMKTYLVETLQASQQSRRGAFNVKLADDETKTVALQKVVDLIGLGEKDKINLRVKIAVSRFPKSVRGSVESFLLARLDAPLFVYDAATTDKDITAAGLDIMKNPPASCFREYDSGAVGVPRTAPESETKKGMQQSHIYWLAAENAAYVKDHGVSVYFRTFFRILLLGLLIMFLRWYIVNYRDELLTMHWRSISLMSMLLLMMLIARLMVSAGLPLASILLPVSILTLILTIAFDQRFAMTLGGISVTLIAILVHSSIGFFSIFMATMIVICLQIEQIHQVRTRSRIPVIAGVTALFMTVVIVGVCVWNNVPALFTLWFVLWGAGGIIVGGLIVQGLLPFIERIFGVATGSTLLEWCDASKPLLKRLAVEATGTYNHSLQVGAMCEAAAEAIGAQGLLARVGAYYHDIGKINKPQYFSENQTSGENRHEKLQPAMSQLIIQGHVKDGLELAREYGLPAALREFIASHHGTTLVQYFYQAAARRSEEDNAPKPEEHQFRYPGPKPQSREVAILMLADAAESSVRALPDLTPSRISQQVHRIVAARLEDGQLDECDITLKEVHKIEESLTRSLCGMYHSRIAYPDDDKKKAEQQAAKQDKPAAEDAKENGNAAQ